MKLACFMLFACVFLVTSLAVGQVRIEPVPDTANDEERHHVANGMLTLADAADAALDFAVALDRYDAIVVYDPYGNAAARARARGDYLRARADGGFAPLVALERLRRDPTLSNDPRKIDELVKLAESWPAGLVRVEVWVLAAEAYDQRFGRKPEAETLSRKILGDKDADHVALQKAARDLVTVMIARGDLDGAALVVRDVGPHADPNLAKDIARLHQRRQLHFVALGILGVAVVLASTTWVRAARTRRLADVLLASRRSSKLAVAYAVYVAGAGALLATGYETGTSKPFLYFGLALLPLLLFARAWAAAGAQTRVARAVRGAVCASGALGIAFLVLEQVNAAFLEGMGL